MQRDERTITAFHEAGHAVMAMACGFIVSKISISADETSKGHVIWHLKVEASDECDAEKRVVSLMAGMVADTLHWEMWGHGTTDDMPLGWLSDRRIAMEVLESINEAHLLDAYIVFVRRYLRRTDVWPFVELISKTVQITDSIDGQDLLNTIAASCPKLTANDWNCLQGIKAAVIKLQDDDKNGV